MKRLAAVRGGVGPRVRKANNIGAEGDGGKIAGERMGSLCDAMIQCTANGLPAGSDPRGELALEFAEKPMSRVRFVKS